MRARIENHHERAIGTEAGLLQPGDSIELELTDAEFEAWQGVDYVEVSDLDRPKGGKDKGRAAKDSD